MLKLETRYILRHKNTEKVISIQTKADQEYWAKYEGNPEFVFTQEEDTNIKGEHLFEGDKPAVSSKITIHKASDDVGCQACSA